MKNTEPLPSGFTPCDVTRQQGTPDLQIEVIGYHCVREEAYESPGGLDNTRIMMFHTPMPVMLGSGKWEEMPAHALTVFDSAEPSAYGTIKGTWDHSWVRVRGKRVTRLLAEAGVRTGEIYPFGTPEEFLYWLRQLYREAAQARPSGRILECLLSALLHRITQMQNKDEPTIDEGVLRVAQWIDTHCTEPLTLQELSRRAGHSQSHFCALFRKQIGQAPLQYANAQRLRLAAELLENHRLSIKEIAAECGFYDVYHFSKRFSNAYGKSPRAFRQEHAPNDR